MWIKILVDWKAKNINLNLKIANFVHKFLLQFFNFPVLYSFLSDLSDKGLFTNHVTVRGRGEGVAQDWQTVHCLRKNGEKTIQYQYEEEALKSSILVWRYLWTVPNKIKVNRFFIFKQKIVISCRYISIHNIFFSYHNRYIFHFFFKSYLFLLSITCLKSNWTYFKLYDPTALHKSIKFSLFISRNNNHKWNLKVVSDVCDFSGNLSACLEW